MIKFYIPHFEQTEKIILLLRRHWFILAYKILFWAIVGILPLLVYIIDPSFIAVINQGTLLYPVVVLFLSLYYLYLWLFMFHSFVDYYLDVWIVTTERIVNIELKGLFSHHVSEQKLDRIQDVTSELKGVLGTFLDYGTVYIQTAGEQPRFIFKQVPHPQSVAKKIIAIIERQKKFHKILENNQHVSTKTS